MIRIETERLFLYPISDEEMQIIIDNETDPNNQASKNILTKIGFIPTGEVGEEGPRFVLKENCR